MRINIVVWGESHEIWTQPKTALCNAVDDALKCADTAERYRDVKRWELRSANGTLIETYRSPESLGMGDGAQLFLSPAKIGFAG
jgi:hypothetical protein